MDTCNYLPTGPKTFVKQSTQFYNKHQTFNRDRHEIFDIDSSNSNHQDAFICEPEVRTVDIVKQDEFFVIGSDGVFDCLSNENCVNIVRRALMEGKELSEAARALTQAALDLGSNDNVTAVVIALNLCQ